MITLTAHLPLRLLALNDSSHRTLHLQLHHRLNKSNKDEARPTRHRAAAVQHRPSVDEQVPSPLKEHGLLQRREDGASARERGTVVQRHVPCEQIPVPVQRNLRPHCCRARIARRFVPHDEDLTKEEALRGELEEASERGAQRKVQQRREPRTEGGDGADSDLGHTQRVALAA